MNLIIFL